MKIRNKLISLFASTAIISCAAATNVLAQAKNFAGPSLAISGSYASGTTNLAAGTSSVDFGENTTVIGGDIAYTFPVDNNFFIGLGVTYDFGKTKAGGLKDDEDNLRFSLDKHYSYYVQPGYALSNNTALFAKLGYNEAEGKVTVTTTGNYGGSVTKDFSGWGYGFGIKSLLNNNVFVQAEAGYVKYDTEKSGTVSFKPEVVTGTISIGYKF
jgi:hypothetical protein